MEAEDVAAAGAGAVRGRGGRSSLPMPRVSSLFQLDF
jgi:hypothetical protein